MKKSIVSVYALSLAFFMVSCAGGNTENQTETTEDKTVEETTEVTELMIKGGDSKVNWEGEVLGVYAHQGTVDITEGMLSLEGDKVTAGNFTVDMTTMVATDDNYTPEEGKTPEKLIGHLKSADFFMVDSFPKAMFEISAHNVESKTITGNLTVRGITNEETVEDVTIDLNSGTATGLLNIDRQKYDVAFKHPLEDVVLSDDITLAIELKM
ncbi:MAG: hypothetical protein CMO34_02240 [Verrucomicrobia bacterium]|nr:hypothetical protein [Verrucomicrobiota bacterium]|tara:strand:- start:128 stop:760 length:633 start_codon:yes stop_codon:yes gene_type:complete